MERAFFKTAPYYDKMYAGQKDYAAEVPCLMAILGGGQPARGGRLLDVACGTGMHVMHFKEHFDVEGLDICDGLLHVARQRNPEATFHQGDMTNFDLGRRFDLVTCLFSSIGYVRTLEGLSGAVRCMTDHLVHGGVLVIEPWFTPDNWHPNTVHGLFVDEPELKIARVSTSFVDGRVSIFDRHHLIGTPQGTEYAVEHHELGLFETAEMRSVMEGEGLTVRYDDVGLTGRGLFVGTKTGMANNCVEHDR